MTTGLMIIYISIHKMTDDCKEFLFMLKKQGTIKKIGNKIVKISREMKQRAKE